MKSKTIEISGARFFLSEAGGIVTMTVMEAPSRHKQVVVPMTKEQCSTLSDALKIMSGQMREHSI